VATVQEDMVGMGGQGKVVEIGRISLGILAAIGNKREVRILAIVSSISQEDYLL
jgi:hypothetical protein